MSRFCKQYKTDVNLRALAINLCNQLDQKDYSGEVRALTYFVQNYIRYVRDVSDVETVQTPIVTLQLKGGDCDDKSTLLACLLESIGHKTRFVAVGFTPDSFCHVYVETLCGTQWIPLETTEQVAVGWSPPNVVARMVEHN